MVVVVDAAFVADINAAVAAVATVAAIGCWIVYGVVGDEAAMCFGHFVLAHSRPPVHRV